MLQKYIVLFLVGIFIIYSGVPVVSAKELPKFYRGIRPLGMGDAFTAVSDDENSFFYNPAGLRLKSVERGGKLLNPLFEFSKGTLDLYDDVVELDGAAINTRLINDRIGEHHHLRVSLFPHLLIPPFGVGILAQGVGDVDTRNPVFTEVTTDLRFDLGLVLGGGRNFDRGLVGGVTAKYIQRRGVIKTYTATDIAADSFNPKNDLKTRSDFSFDLGVMIALSEWTSFKEEWQPMAGIVLQNITDLDFEEVGVYPMQLNLGVAIHPEIGMMPSTIALDFVDITRRIGTDDDFLKRTHLGAEFKFPKVVSVRLGVNQGYLTGGVTVNFWIVKFDIATFSEELGASFRQRENRRTLAQISVGF